LKLIPLKALIAILILFLVSPLYSQRILMLEKLGSGRKYTYKEGDDITLKRHADSTRFTGTITTLADSGFILDMVVYVRLGEVSKIWRRFPHRKSMGNKIIIAGGVFAGIVMINNLAHNRAMIDPVYLVPAVALSGLGVLWRSSSVQQYPIGARWKLKILDTTFL
jgi:hypothetical protein